MNWYQAAAYCNWLSKQEGLPESQWCYEPLRSSAGAGRQQRRAVGRLVGSISGEQWAVSQANGPGIQGGHEAGQRSSATQRLSAADASGDGICQPGGGDHEPLLRPDRRAAGQICLVQHNAQDRTWPVGSKKPNDLGLFDVHGNVWCWCQERYKDNPKEPKSVIVDKEDMLEIKGKDSRVLCGGAYSYPASNARCANRSGMCRPAVTALPASGRQGLSRWAPSARESSLPTGGPQGRRTRPMRYELTVFCRHPGRRRERSRAALARDAIRVLDLLRVGSYWFRVDVVDQYGDVSSPSAVPTIKV